MMQENWTEIEEYLLVLLSKFTDIFDDETLQSIKHYIDHAEYEMAFEGLGIEIMKLKTLPPLDYARIVAVGKLLKLDKESVYDDNFWNKFQKFIEGARRRK